MRKLKLKNSSSSGNSEHDFDIQEDYSSDSEDEKLEEVVILLKTDEIDEYDEGLFWRKNLIYHDINEIL